MTFRRIMLVGCLIVGMCEWVSAMFLFRVCRTRCFILHLLLLGVFPFALCRKLKTFRKFLHVVWMKTTITKPKNESNKFGNFWKSERENWIEPKIACARELCLEGIITTTATDKKTKRNENFCCVESNCEFDAVSFFFFFFAFIFLLSVFFFYSLDKWRATNSTNWKWRNEKKWNDEGKKPLTVSKSRLKWPVVNEQRKAK